MKKLQQKIAGEITLSTDPGASMKKWRNIFGFTQTEVAEYLDLTPSTISDYESNRRKSPGIKVIKRFVEALLELDRKKGGKVINKMTEETPQFFEVIDFPKRIEATEFAEKINAKPETGKRRIKDIQITGYSIIDSLKAITQLPVEEFRKIYGTSTDRALIFTKVGIGRSPMVAIRVTKLRPNIVVYQGLDEMNDKIARKISEVEKIPILTTQMKPSEIKKKLKKFE